VSEVASPVSSLPMSRRGQLSVISQRGEVSPGFLDCLNWPQHPEDETTLLMSTRRRLQPHEGSDPRKFHATWHSPLVSPLSSRCHGAPPPVAGRGSTALGPQLTCLSESPVRESPRASPRMAPGFSPSQRGIVHPTLRLGPGNRRPRDGWLTPRRNSSRDSRSPGTDHSPMQRRPVQEGSSKGIHAAF
jgi:hypothetical protein